MDIQFKQFAVYFGAYFISEFSTQLVNLGVLLIYRPLIEDKQG